MADHQGIAWGNVCVVMGCEVSEGAQLTLVISPPGGGGGGKGGGEWSLQDLAHQSWARLLRFTAYALQLNRRFALHTLA
jgi:hypothetical protein